MYSFNSDTWNFSLKKYKPHRTYKYASKFTKITPTPLGKIGPVLKGSSFLS